MSQEHQSMEELLYSTAAEFVYPPTPNVAAAVMERLRTDAGHTPRRHWRPAWVVVVALLLVLMGMLAVPPVRAVLLDFLQIGAVRIYLTESMPTPGATAPATAATAPTITPPAMEPASLLDLAGETTLTEAAARAEFPIHLPTYPSDLGRPDRVYWQNLGGPAVVLVWLDPAQPNRVRMSLHLLSERAFAQKMQPPSIQETTVHGQPALWVTGPYVVQTDSGDYTLHRLIDGHVLIWTEGGITYRLEVDVPLAEAVRVAESLVELPETLLSDPTPAPLRLHLRGKTTLVEAEQQLTFPILLPTYPADLGPPDEVFVQRTNGDFLILVWLQPDDPQRVRLVLYALGPGVRLTKGDPPVLAEATVNGRRAIWMEGGHYLEVEGQGHEKMRFVGENVLIWTLGPADQAITYRLESDLPPAEAIRIAESLQ